MSETEKTADKPERIESGDGFKTVSRRTFLLGVSAASGLAMGMQQARGADFNFKPFTFAVISDVHLTTGQADNLKLLQESQLFLQDVAKAMLETNPDFIIFAGDQVEGPGRDDCNWNLFIDVLASLESPWYFVLGESDVTGVSAVDRMRTYGPDFKSRGLNTGKSYWSCDPVPGVHLVGLDTANANSNTGVISDSQLAWLKEDLNNNHGKFTILVSHHPLLPPPPYDGGPPFEDYNCTQGASVREIMANSDVRLVLSGHVPINKIQREREIWFVSCPPVSMYPCQFKTFQVTPAGIFMETHDVRYPALVKKAQKIMSGSSLAFQYSNHHPDQFLALAQGGELDRSAALPLAPGGAQKLRKQKAGKSHKESGETKTKKEVQSTKEPKDKNSKEIRSKETKDSKETDKKEESKNSKESTKPIDQKTKDTGDAKPEKKGPDKKVESQSGPVETETDLKERPASIESDSGAGTGEIKDQTK